MLRKNCSVLTDFRKEILPSVVENWTDLDDVEKEQSTPLNDFFCGFQFLAGLATCADETGKLWEINSQANTNYAADCCTQVASGT